MDFGRRLAALLVASCSLAAEPDLRLVEAMQDQDVSTARVLLQQRVNVNVPQADGATALAWAAHWDNLEIADLLIRAGADLNAANEYGVTPLALACANGSNAMAVKLLQAGADANAAQWSGETALMTCSRSGSMQAVEAILARGGKVDALENRRGQTALMWAVAARQTEIVRLLVSRGADVKVKSNPLRDAVPLEHKTYFWDVAEAIDDTGAASTNRPNVAGSHLAPYSSKGGYTALLFAAQRGDLAAARVLVEAGADVNAGSPDGSPLIIAAASGHDQVASYLLENGADPNAVDNYGVSALHYAVWEGFLGLGDGRPLPTDSAWFRPNMPELVKVLLAHGADPNLRVTTGFPPYDFPLLRRVGNFQMSQLVHAGATAFFLAAASADVQIMRMLLAAGADPKIGTKEGATPLMVAAGLGRVTDRNKEKSGQALEAVKLMLELGAEVSAREAGGRTALQGAAYGGENAIIQLLADRGADLNAMDNYGRTALLIAAGDPKRLIGIFNKRWIQLPRPHASTAELLLKLGATPIEKLKIERRVQADAARNASGPITNQ